MLTFVPQTANATSCLPIVDALVPADGEPLPVTALPLAAGDCGIELTNWEVDIDGEPGSLEYIDAGLPYLFVSLGIEPPPPEGAVVEIRGCVEGCWDAEIEFDLFRTYTITGPDPDAPAPPSLLELGHSDEIISQYDFETGEEELVPVRRWNIHFEPPALDEPVVWELEVGPAGSSGSQTARIMEDGDQNIVITRYVDNAGQEVCATVRAHDLSGNVSADSEICVEVDEGDTLPEVPGGGDSGDDDSGDSGEGDGDSGEDPTTGGDGSSGPDTSDQQDDDDAASCACTTGQRSPLGVGALLGLMVLGLRRRSRR